MPLMPFQVLGIWLRGLFSLAILGAVIYLFSVLEHPSACRRP